jgi:hypothetical protein
MSRRFDCQMTGLGGSACLPTEIRLSNELIGILKVVEPLDQQSLVPCFEGVLFSLAFFTRNEIIIFLRVFDP